MLVKKATGDIKPLSNTMLTHQTGRDIHRNSSPLGQNGPFLADDIFKWIFLNENDRISIQVSLKFVPGSPIDNNPALV